ncbi:MAG: PIN domain-containing protein [Lentisphaerae bacterium]|jgi:uncharacterized protein|nr:PIN domain-containing protein [Lentisphaerota bacterium]MBT5611925.1 PIN domain-containing protein [Lentisphaerota bacterium]MBT7057921.1 PIN domain-containing protein [Lentisphaerota bacterium]MBT7843692.1 PIN domain-containing protein [Lentisphaerota bacterium]
MTRYLLDVNVLISLFDPAHANHEAAHNWFAETGSKAWASCPLTENGFVRVTSHSSYPTVDVRPEEAIGRLRTFTRTHPGHEFWSDSVSLTDDSIFDGACISSSGQVTDSYLLGLAKEHKGTLATFDRRIALASVRAADDGLLELLRA